MEGFSFGAVAASVVGGIVLLPLTLWVATVLETHKPKWRGFDLASITPKALGMAASVMLIYLSFVVLIALGSRDAPEGLSAPVAPITEESINRWLSQSADYKLEDADPEFYPNLRFEYRADPREGHTWSYIYLYQHEDDPVDLIRAETRIELARECWGTLNVGDDGRIAQVKAVRQSIHATGIDPELNGERAQMLMILGKKIAIRLDGSGADLFVSLKELAVTTETVVEMNDQYCRNSNQ